MGLGGTEIVRGVGWGVRRALEREPRLPTVDEASEPTFDLEAPDDLEASGRPRRAGRLRPGR